jgi:hypothetical protein
MTVADRGPQLSKPISPEDDRPSNCRAQAIAIELIKGTRVSLKRPLRASIATEGHSDDDEA